MKYVILLAMVLSVVCLQAKPVDEMIELITASDLDGFYDFSFADDFTIAELVILKNLNESVLAKRKDDWNLNHKRQMYNWRQELLWIGVAFGVAGCKTYRDSCKHKLPNTHDGSLLIAGLISVGITIYCGIKLIDSRICKKDHSELLYKNAMLITAALELMVDRAQRGSQAVVCA